MQIPTCVTDCADISPFPWPPKMLKQAQTERTSSRWISLTDSSILSALSQKPVWCQGEHHYLSLKNRDEWQSAASHTHIWLNTMKTMTVYTEAGKIRFIQLQYKLLFIDHSDFSHQTRWSVFRSWGWSCRTKGVWPATAAYQLNTRRWALRWHLYTRRLFQYHLFLCHLVPFYSTVKYLQLL